MAAETHQYWKFNLLGGLYDQLQYSREHLPVESEEAHLIAFNAKVSEIESTIDGLEQVPGAFLDGSISQKFHDWRISISPKQVFKYGRPQREGETEEEHCEAFEATLDEMLDAYPEV